MRRVIVLAGMLAVLMAPAAAYADTSGQAATTPRALTKNQKISLLALDAHKAAVNRYSNFLATKPAKVSAIASRIKCVVDRIFENGTYASNFGTQDPLDQQRVFFALQYSYWFGYMHRILPRTKGKYSARAIKGIFSAAANSAAKLKPDITGERIVRGLRAQVALIDLYRGFPDIRACAVIDTWATNGFDLGYLGPFTDLYTVLVLKLNGSTAQERVTAAVAALKTVPGITSSEANEFNSKLVDDPFQAIGLPLAP